MHRLSLAAVLALFVFAQSAVAQLASMKQPSADEIQKMADAMPEKATVKPAKARKILIFCRCEGFKHSSIPFAAKALEMMGEKTGAYTSVISDDMAVFTPESLAQFDAVVLNNTTGLKFQDPKQREALLEFVNSGKGVVGIHAATDNFPTWPEGAAVVGGKFAGHPWGKIAVKLDDPEHPLLKVFGGQGFHYRDEIYKFREPYTRENLRVLLSMDLGQTSEEDQKKGRDDGDNAVSWIQEIGAGREFYCSLGHRHDVFWDPVMLQYYLDGIQYATGDLKADATPSAKLKEQPKPAPAPEAEK